MNICILGCNVNIIYVITIFGIHIGDIRTLGLYLKSIHTNLETFISKE